MIKSECRSMQKPTGYNTHKKNIITYFSLVRPQFYYFFFFLKSVTSVQEYSKRKSMRCINSFITTKTHFIYAPGNVIPSEITGNML